MAVSFCGNHDNRGYNAGWGETYHGQLVVEEDSEAEVQDNYETASNQYYAKNLVGKLLLIHGTAGKQFASHRPVTMAYSTLLRSGLRK